MTDRQRALWDGSLIGFRVAATIAFAAAIGAWFVWLRPQGLGGPAAYVVVSGESMVPTLQSADLAIAQQQDRYAVGDIVVYRVPPGVPAEGSLVIHRIVGGDGTSFFLGGDGTTGEDLWRPTTEDVVGRVTFVVPQAGRLLPLLRMPLLWASLAASLTVFFILGSRPRRARPVAARADETRWPPAPWVEPARHTG